MYNGKHQQQLFFFFYFTGKREKKDIQCFEKRPIAFGEEKFHNHDVPSKYTRKFPPVHITWPDFRSVSGATLTKCIMAVLGFMVKLRNRPFFFGPCDTQWVSGGGTSRVSWGENRK